MAGTPRDRGACGSRRMPAGEALVFQAKFEGAVVGDEAQAMLAARQVLLAAGGSAADAAVALTFALAATYPFRAASLGGGGQCLVYVPADQTTTRFSGTSTSCLAVHVGARPDDSGSAIAVPGTVRGMDALQERFGRLQWSRTLFGRPSGLAQFGHPVSRALRRRSVGNRGRCTDRRSGRARDLCPERRPPVLLRPEQRHPARSRPDDRPTRPLRRCLQQLRRCRCG